MPGTVYMLRNAHAFNLLKPCERGCCSSHFVDGRTETSGWGHWLSVAQLSWGRGQDWGSGCFIPESALLPLCSGPSLSPCEVYICSSMRPGEFVCRPIACLGFRSSSPGSSSKHCPSPRTWLPVQHCRPSLWPLPHPVPLTSDLKSQMQ